jgi:hypothetical protein
MNRKKHQRALSALPRKDESYEVGYGKPPVETQFKKDRSGNPRGRPKGSKNKKPALNEPRLQDIILEEAYRKVSVNDGNKKLTYTMAQAVMRSIAVNSAKGGVREQELFTALVERVERERIQDHRELIESATNYKMQWEMEYAARARPGRTGYDPVLHPEDVHISYRTGVVRLAFTQDEKELFALIREGRPVLLEEKKALIDQLKTEEDPEARKDIEAELGTTLKALELIDQILPE